VQGIACLAGAILGAPTLRLKGDYLAIVTLGFGEIVRLFMNNLDRPVSILPMALKVLTWSIMSVLAVLI
jgi:ABC-type branched-subunit amino acid transport system permease subunit